MDALLTSVLNMGKSCGVSRIILFGSRARGDNDTRSDYDLAFVSSAMDRALKNEIKNKLDELDTLCKIDAVFLNDLNGVDELTKNILKDGVLLMSRFDNKFANFKNAILRLEEAVADFDRTRLLSVRDGVIQRFEFTTELAWKTVREYLLEQGFVNINTPKAVMTEAYSIGIIGDEKGWIDILNDRNGTSHVYDEKEADAVFTSIKECHIKLFELLRDKLDTLQGH